MNKLVAAVLSLAPHQMKTFLQQVTSFPALILILGLTLWLGTSLPQELLQLDQRLYEIAGGNPALSPQQYLSQPEWLTWGKHVIWAAALCFLLFMLPIPTTTIAFLLAILFIASLLFTQLSAQFKLGIWLPFGVLIQFLIVSSPIILFWAHRRKRWHALTQQRDAALMELAEHKRQQGQIEQALTKLKQCEPGKLLAEAAYEIALLQEQRRQYKAAQKTYQWISGFARSYKDVATKAAGNLAQDHLTEGLAATQTINISQDQKRQPVLGRYRIERELGRGAMGIVYLGIDPKISRRVAIKTLSYSMFDSSELEEVKQRFFREAEAAGRLNHPNIVTVYDVGEEPDLSFIAMDYVQGQSLSQHTNEGTLLDVSTVYQLMLQVANALDYAHQQHIVHRDIKPSNLLFNPEQHSLKVADFGIARIVDSSSTKTGDILGSPIYMSPEQLKGQKVTGATDIYSLGVTFYQLLTGTTPYFGDSIANLAYQILNKKYKSVRELRPELPSSATRIINKAMAKNPDKRFADAKSMSLALTNALKRDFGITPSP